MNRVVITGMGIVSCLGHDPEVYFNNLLEGKSGISLIETFDASSLPVRIAGEIKDFDPFEYVDKKFLRRYDKCIAYSIAASKRALIDAGLESEEIEKLNKKRAGVIIGSGLGGIQTFYEQSVNFHNGGVKKVSPFFIAAVIPDMSSGMVAMEYGFMGPNFSVSSACASSNHAIITAAEYIRSGKADFMITGGTEAAINGVTMAGFCSNKALSSRNDDPATASRPFDKDRDGFVAGEGCGIFIFESEEHAKKRGAKIYAEYKGGGVSCDAYHVTAPREDGEGVLAAIEAALEDGKLNPCDIQLVNGHSTSTPLGDVAEATAVSKVFKGYTDKIKMNATKSMIGHGLGASGALELIGVVKSIEKSKIHPSINVFNIDPEIKLDVVKDGAIEMKVDNAISNSFGFGGHNAVVAVGKYK
jgi:3-oxoacyl-[acyl-carrier-protein] synthase II